MKKIGLICVIFWIIIGTYIFFSPFKDLSIWKGVEEHLDEFVFDHASSELFGHGYYVFKLYDEENTFICKVCLDEKFHDASVHNDISLVGSSNNYFKSKKVYNVLIKRVPDEFIYDPHKDKWTKEYLIDKLQKCNHQ